MTIKEGIEKLENSQNLSANEAAEVALLMTKHEECAEEKKQFLLTLASLGESPSEIQGFSTTFRELALNPGLEEFAPFAIDVCGTGGDHAGSFNISSTVAMILAAANVPVIKHGNRSITSQCGSAQFLEALGIKIAVEMDVHKKAMESLNFTFLFAPAFHPAFKEIMPIRQELASEGKRTLFNILGPLINPAQPAYQLLGVFSESLLTPLANSLHSLGLKNGYTAHCKTSAEEPDIDELSCAGNSLMSGFGNSQGERRNIQPSDLGLSPCSISDLKGGSVDDNLAILDQFLSGKINSGLTDSIFMNAGAAFQIVGKSSNIIEGIELSREIVTSGKLASWIEKAQTFYQEL